MATEVVRWRRKPEPPRDREDQLALQWNPPQLIGPLRTLARTADDQAQLAVAEIGGTKVLVVRYTRYDDYGSRIEYLNIEPGEWLAYSPDEGFLYSSTDGNWTQFYERVP
jgi:hypothetical protein